jgi:hypothetical protein
VLDKLKKVIIGDVSDINLNDSNILIKSQNLVLRFDMTGKFLNSFGKIGRGPEEYLRGSPYTTTPGFDEVLILRSMMQDYLIYKLNGDLIEKRKISYPRDLYSFTCVSDSIFLMTFWFLGSFMNEDEFNEMPGIAGIYDIEGHPIDIIEHPLKNISVSKSDIKKIASPNPTFRYFDNRIVLTIEGDTIYEISKDSIFPGFIFNWGQIPHNISANEIYFRQSGPSNKASYYGSLLETTKKAFRPVKNLDKLFLIEYDKVTGLGRSMSENSKNLGFINDLDGGTNYYPYWTNRAGDIWIAVEDAFSFREKHSDDFLSSSPAIYPGMKERLINFRNSLYQDDNPVLKIVYLK